MQRLPVYHEHYADALRVAQLVIADLSLAIRTSNSFVLLPTILIDMATVFEEYARQVLTERLEVAGIAEVKNGNKGGAGGAKEALFESVLPGNSNPPITPDIVITVDGVPRLIIDVKYKPPKDIPDRPDVNQVICYGARYGCENVMILFAGRPPHKPHVEQVGKIGSYLLYAGYIDLGADRIEDEEECLAKAVEALL